MVALTCYRLEDPPPGVASNLADFVDHEDAVSHGEIQASDFDAELFGLTATPRPARWDGFVRSGFPGVTLGLASSPSALLVVRAKPPSPRRKRIHFAFAFGPAGRYLLAQDAYERGYGLRCALNVLYPRGSSAEPRLRSIDSKRRGAETTRIRTQVARTADFEIFDVSRLRDVVNRAIGRPPDVDVWGTRIGGADSLTLNLSITMDEIGKICRQIEVAAVSDDYKDQFGWIDDIRPIQDPNLRSELADFVLDLMRQRRTAGLDLAPPEIVDWDRLSDFRYSFDRPQGQARSPVTHPELRIGDFLTGLSRTSKLATLDEPFLRSHRISGLDANGELAYEWSAWRCLIAEFTHRGRQYLLDEGEFFVVGNDYLNALDAEIDAIPRNTAKLPKSTPTTHEAVYNTTTADASSNLALLDRRLVKVDTRTSSVEVCDLLSDSGQLIHVKRKLGSSDLSHLFAQGLVSADLLQSQPEFRRKAQAETNAVTANNPRFDLLDVASLDTSSFEVIYAIIADWRARTPSAALPFFSKVNLREVHANLRARGFRVAIEQVSV